MFKNFFKNFKKKTKKIFFKKQKRIEISIYKSRNFLLTLKGIYPKELKYKNKSIISFFKFLKKKHFNIYFFQQFFNLKKLIFIKNRKTFYNTIHVKYKRNKHSKINFLKNSFFCKNIFKNHLFWYKKKKPKFKNFFLKMEKIS